MKKKIVTIAASLVTVVITLCTSTACCLFSGTDKAAVKAEIKSALAKAGTVAYNTAGRAKLESFLSEQVAAGKLSESQKAEALAAADQGVEKLTAYLESASKSTTATDTGTTANTSGTGATATTVPTAATDTSGTK